MDTKRFFLAVLGVSLLFTTGYSQSHQVLEKQYFLSEPITGLIVDGAFSVEFTTGDRSSVTVIGDVETTPKVKVETVALKKEGETFVKVSSDSKKNAKPCKLVIEGKRGQLKLIQLSGIVSFETGESPIETDELVLSVSGASSVKIDGTFQTLVIESSGASQIRVGGTTHSITVASSGVSEVDISSLEYLKSEISSTGVSKITTKKGVNNAVTTNGASSASVNIENGAYSYQWTSGNEQGQEMVEDKIFIKTVESDDGAMVNIVENKFIVKDGGNTETITIGPYDINIKQNKAVKVWNKRKSKFDGHWGGIELAINGYNTSDFNMNFPKEYEYMDLTFPKSMAFYLNLLEYNISFSKNQKWGMLSGLGFEWHNYRFLQDVWLEAHDGALQGFYFLGDPVKKTKLMVSYMTVPVIFEFQTNNKSRTNSFHVGVGVVGGLRIGSHTKAKVESRNSTYQLINPNWEYPDDIVLASYTTSGTKIKNHDDFYLNPVKLDVTARVGWSHLNLFATYSLTPMFREKRGPELYPWAIGITLLGW